MDPQTVLFRVLLLLLFLHLSPLGGCPTLDLSQDDNRSEKEPLSCIPEPKRTLEQGRSSEEAWKTKKAASAGGLGPHNNVLQTLWKLKNPKEKPDSGCFGRKIDRIGFGGLGCKAAETEAKLTRAAIALFTEEETESQRDGLLLHSKYPDQQRMKVGAEEPVTGSPGDRLISHPPPGPL